MSTEWICKRCFHSTTTKSNLLSHLRNKKHCTIDDDNGGNPIPVQNYIEELLAPKQPKKYSCPHCDSRFSYNQSMNKHIRYCKSNPTNKKDDKDKIIEDLQAKIAQYEQQGQSSNHTIHNNKQQVDEIIQDSVNSPKVVKDINRQTIDELRELLAFYRKENEALKSQLVQVVFNIGDNNVKKQQYKKKNIPHAVKIKSWNTHVGELVPKVKCLCCHNIDITQHNFHCGHIVAESNGGSLDIDNLLPICNVCNYSMGSTNMHEFQNTYGFSNIQKLNKAYK